MAAKFPRRREDGTFSVCAIFSKELDIDDEEIETWLRDWLSKNDVWQRQWRGQGNRVVETELLRLSDAFERYPYIVKQDKKALAIRFDGTPSAPYWKDWMVRLVEEIKKRFEGLDFQKAENAE